MENLKEKTLKSIVLEHNEYIPVLEKYNLDYCCKGSKTLDEASADKNIAVDKLLKELESTEPSKKPQQPFTKMSADELISYILEHHHTYIKKAIPTIKNHLQEVIEQDGKKFPNLEKVQSLFNQVAESLISHEEKEEKVLFPSIKNAISNQQELKENQKAAPVEKSTGTTAPINKTTGTTATMDRPTGSAPVEKTTGTATMDRPTGVKAPMDATISSMEEEHEKVADLMFEIRDITNHYTAPENASAMHKACLGELKTFEEDLHQHVHLENNILFPLVQQRTKQEINN
jgi:regulator of cell morphogenesis and NO signaling